MARCPVAGKVKTRLLPRLGPSDAARLQQAMIEDLLERLARGSESWDLELRLTGDCAAGLHIPDRWSVAPQGSGDLGDRLVRAMEAAARAAVDRLIFRGADAPLLPRALVDGALASLARREAVVAPAEDGGYALIGLALGSVRAERLARLFRGIPWGAEGVLAATRAAASGAGLGLAELPMQWDVDRPEDLRRLARALAAPNEAARAPRTARLLAGLGLGR